ncbi:hypothetical protein GWI33_006677 [Rhynchophorus ferrugineus]|uniref:Uncharacterized protein n=1 Tax=Rhynchophorus ferrugineus TaxID=354439 RepID=A0A834IEK8_RHYFE|nr:hypothetical protein GWI33_006677 [Rhynchophorus ferrugineus]
MPQYIILVGTFQCRNDENYESRVPPIIHVRRNIFHNDGHSPRLICQDCPSISIPSAQYRQFRLVPAPSGTCYGSVPQRRRQSNHILKDSNGGTLSGINVRPSR